MGSCGVPAVVLSWTLASIACFSLVGVHVIRDPFARLQEGIRFVDPSGVLSAGDFEVATAGAKIAAAAAEQALQGTDVPPPVDQPGASAEHVRPTAGGQAPSTERAQDSAVAPAAASAAEEVAAPAAAASAAPQAAAPVAVEGGILPPSAEDAATPDEHEADAAPAQAAPAPEPPAPAPEQEAPLPDTKPAVVSKGAKENIKAGRGEGKKDGAAAAAEPGKSKKRTVEDGVSGKPARGVDLSVRGKCRVDPKAILRPRNLTESELPLRLDTLKIAGGKLLSDALPQSSVASCAGEGAVTLRTCHLKNICLDVRKAQFLWNSRTNPKPPDSKELMALTMTTGHTKVGFEPSPVGPQDKAPAAGASVVTVRGAYALVTRRVAPWNAGHMVIQTATALERLANDYGVCEPQRRVVLFADDCAGVSAGSHTDGRYKLCNKFSKSFSAPLSAYPLLTVKTLQEGEPARIGDTDLAKVDYLCFEDLLGGTGRDPRGAVIGEMSTWVAPYREKLFLFNGLEPPKPKSNGCNVVFTWKLGMHGLQPIRNPLEVEWFLKEWAKEHKSTFEGFNLGDVTLKQQLLAFSGADIHVTVAGSTAYSSLNLGPGTEMICLCRSYDRGVFLKSGEAHFSEVTYQADISIPELRQNLDGIAKKRGCR